MDPNVYVNVNFWNVTWPKLPLQSKFSKLVRCEFLLDREGNLFGKEELKDILAAWLYDEFNACPTDFDFLIEP